MAKNDHFYRQKGANPNQKEQILTDFDGRLPAIMWLCILLKASWAYLCIYYEDLSSWTT